MDVYVEKATELLTFLLNASCFQVVLLEKTQEFPCDTIYIFYVRLHILLLHNTLNQVSLDYC